MLFIYFIYIYELNFYGNFEIVVLLFNFVEEESKV